jgi:hypothetical protein
MVKAMVLNGDYRTAERQWTRNRDVVLYRMTLFAFSCPAVLEAAAHEKKREENQKTERSGGRKQDWVCLISINPRLL